MNIISMAREAATKDGSTSRADGKTIVLYAAKTNQFLERFAALVRADERDRVTKMLGYPHVEAPCGHEETIVKGSLVHCKKCDRCFGVD